VDWSYQTAYHSAAINSRYNRVTWRSSDEKWDASLEGTNLTDEVYYLGFFDNQGSTQNTLGAPAPPRIGRPAPRNPLRRRHTRPHFMRGGPIGA